MSSNFKAELVSTNPQTVGRRFYRLAIVGAATLKGKEVVEVLNERNFPSADVKLLDDDESLGQLETVGDELTFIQNLRAEEFHNIDFSFFASDPECTRKTWKIAQNAGSVIVDLSYALEDEPGASVRSPWIERERGQVVVPELQPGPVVVAHPAAVVLALLLLRLQKVGGLRHVAAIVFEPASEHGQKGMDELHQQTVNLLSFQPLPKAVFDAQVAFNLVSSYGGQSVSSLSTIEGRILKHYQRIAGDDALVPSVLPLQAATFHSHAFAVHAELDQTADLAGIALALAGEHVRITRGPDDSPTNVSAAGQGEIQVSVLPDRSRANGFWLWAASDNLRISASTAAECAEAMAATRPRGQIQ
jgi:aspartate-semialdehyde dehydrogenase